MLYMSDAVSKGEHMDNKNMKHTPGPWVIEQCRTKDGTSYHHIRAGSTGVADTYHADPITVLGWGALAGHLDARHGNPADARLIAAAPDLLAALKRLAREVGLLSAAVTPNELRAAEKQARDAIAKAEGR